MRKKTLILSLVLCLLLCTATQTAFALAEAESNDTLGEAQTITLDELIEGEIDETGDQDFFSFELVQAGKLSIDVTSYIRYYSIFLYNSDGAQLWKDEEQGYDTSIGMRKDTYTMDLKSGTYYIKINGKQGNGHNQYFTGTYTLEISSIPSNATEQESNNTIAEANALSLSEDITGHIAINDDLDFYSIIFTESGMLTLDVTSYMEYYSIYLYDSNGSVVWKDEEQHYNPATQIRNDVYGLDLTAGTYYLKVTGIRGNGYSQLYTGVYSLKTAFAPSSETFAESNNQITEASVLEFPGKAIGQIAINDSSDYYTFTLPESISVSLEVTSHMRYYSAFLYDTNGATVWSDDQNEYDGSTKVRNDTHVIDLESGTYYLMINGVRGGGYKSSSTGTYEINLNHVHTYGEWEILIPATLSSEGMMHRTCTCGETEVQVIEKLTFPFTDVKSEDYYYDSVVWAVDGTITNGTDDTHFSPEDICTRAQIVTFLWRSQGQPEPVSSENPFVDVVPGENSDWYYKAVLWAVEKGITNGRDATHFDPDGECLRSEVVTFLWRAADQPAVSSDDPFLDVGGDHWFYQPVLWAIREGITNGVDDTHFGPDEECTRAQIVTFLYRSKN